MKKIGPDGLFYHDDEEHGTSVVVHHDGLVAWKSVGDYIPQDLNREDGPATIWPNGWMEWFVFGRKTKYVDVFGNTGPRFGLEP